MEAAASETRVLRDPADDGGPQIAPAIARGFLVAGLILVVIGLTPFLRGDTDRLFKTIPFDQTINMVAAQRLVDREPLYDADASRAQAVDRAGKMMEDSYTVPTNGFPGLPSTALIHVPFLLGSDDAGYAAFRRVSILGMLAAIALVARTLPRGARLAGGVFGSGVLLISTALLQTINYGQGHGFVMLGFALAIWGAARDRWRVVGIGLGLAVALKLTPALIVVYLVVRGRKQVLPWAAGTVAALLAVAAAVGRPADLWTWATEVAPSLSGGAYQALNQSLPGVVARTVSANGDFYDASSIGAWRHLSVLVLGLGTVLLWRRCRNRPIDPLEIGVLILLGLVAGPLTWNHYVTWAVLPVVLFADPRRWTGRSRIEIGILATVLGLAALLLNVLVEKPTPAQVTADAALRLTTSPGAFALLLLLGLGYRLVAPLAPATADGPDPEPAIDELSLEPGASRPVLATT